jgi:hypothetical protein
MLKNRFNTKLKSIIINRRKIRHQQKSKRAA